MKTAIVLLGGGVRQIMLYPENEVEKTAIKYLTPKEGAEEMSVDFRTGSFYGGGTPPSARGFVVQETQGEYYRAFDKSDEGLMIVIRPRAEK